MNFWLGVTDTKWYQYLRIQTPEDINFWQPSGNQQTFRAVKKGSPFLFKLKAPFSAIGGLGFYSAQAFLPLNFAWQAFENRNGCATFPELKSMIDHYRAKHNRPFKLNPVIGCLILTNPIFFDDADWIPLPSDWNDNTVVGKGYSDETPIGSQLWNQVQERLEKYRFFQRAKEIESERIFGEEQRESSRYKEDVLSRVRLGQGAFRVMIAEAYQRACAITGEHTLPVLEAAHIKPFSESGPNLVSNGLFLRSDLHKLFDDGYITITPEYRLEVSSRLKDEFNNGRIYYEMHGRKLIVTPGHERDKPKIDYLIWHNENVYRTS